MYGAIIGDIAGSKYEFHNIKTKDFPFISAGCRFTDDTVMTVAVAKALLRSRKEGNPFKPLLVREMQHLGRRYPHAGYGRAFYGWLRSHDPRPYGSYGNGSAMRVSPCGLIAVTLEEALQLARASAEVTHDHPEGIKGAEATAAAIFMACTGHTKEEIGAYLRENYYDLTQTLDEIRPDYRFSSSCQGSVPQALEAFLESESYEDTVRSAVSIGGDSDTIAAIAGSIAWSYYRMGRGRADSDAETNKKAGRFWPESCEKMVTDHGIDALLPREFVDVIEELDVARMERFDAIDRMGCCRGIPLE